MKKLRGAILALSMIALVGSALPAEAHGRPSTVTYTLGGKVLDGGEQVTSIILDTSRLGAIRPASLSASTFSVHALGTIPAEVDPGTQSATAYDADRTVTGVSVTRSGKIKLDLLSGPSVTNASTLGYVVAPARNVQLDLTYTITQNTPLQLRDGKAVTIRKFRAGALVDPEVDRFSAAVSGSGLNYRLYRPSRGQGARPLVIWLHGTGEGGFPGYYDNEVQLRANRGALGPATVEAQAVFGGAYVVAPQVPDQWYNADQAQYAARLRSLVNEISAHAKIDQRRIYVLGASGGGFMAVKLTAAYPGTFAALETSSAALYLNRTQSYQITADEVRRVGTTPTWFVHAKNDPIIPYEKTSVWAHDLLPGSLITLYEDVTWSGVSYNGHFSWIYTARNAPTTDDGTSLWTWLSQQRRPRS